PLTLAWRKPAGSCQLSGTKLRPARWNTCSTAGSRAHIAACVTSPSEWRSAITSWPASVSAGTSARPTKPVAPVTKTLAIEKPIAHRAELVDRACVVVGAADVQPIAAEAAHGHGFAGGDEIEHQVVKAILPLRWNVAQHAGAEHVDAHAHFVSRARLLAKIRQPSGAVGFQHAEVDDFFEATRRDREHGVGGGVVVVQLAEVEIGQDVAVHHQKLLRQIADQPQRTHGAERLVLERIVDAQSPLAAVLEES